MICNCGIWQTKCTSFCKPLPLFLKALYNRLMIAQTGIETVAKPQYAKYIFVLRWKFDCSAK